MPKFSSFDGRQIAYDAQGSGFPTVLVHGYAQDAFVSWVRPGLFDKIVAAGRRAVAMDNRGHGLSDAPHEVEAYQNDALLKDVRAMLDHLEVERCDLVAYSMGAAATVRLLPSEPRIRAAVLGGIGIGAASSGESGDGSGNSPLAQAMLEPDKKTITNPIARSFRDYADVTGADKQALAAFIRGSAIGREPAGSLDSVTIPVLVIAAENDPLARGHDELAKRFADGRSATVPGTHLNVLNNPAFHDAVLSFLLERS